MVKIKAEQIRRLKIIPTAVALIISALLLLQPAFSLEFSQITDNPLIIQGAIFLIIFFVSFAVLLKTPLGDNRFFVVIICLALAAIATFYLSQLQIAVISVVVSILAIGIFLIIFYIFARFAYSSFGVGGVIIMAGLFLISLYWLPYSSEIPGWLYALAQIGFFIGIGLCILGIIVGIAKGRK